MSARLPLLHKTPFVLDPRPLQEASSPHAGLLGISRAFRSLGLPDLISANLQLRKRKRGFAEGEMIESLVLLQAVGGDCPEDIRLLAHDPCLERGLGYSPPKPTAVREFLELFHDESLEGLRPAREVQKSFILPSSPPVAALAQVQAGCVRRIAKLYEKQGDPQCIATIDQDATIIESHKQAALPHYEGGRGYQPMIAVWAEADLVVADEFRDGNVPARQAPVECAKLAFTALPATVKTRFFRGDSACHDHELIQWLRAPERTAETGGAIRFAISAVMSDKLAEAVGKIGDKEWTTWNKEADGTLRQWAEVDFVPGEASEKKDSQPLRYVGLRLLKPQGSLFADGTDRKHHAVVTNLAEREWKGDRVLEWHREKAGTVEHVHDEVKNWLGGGHMPSQHFACNAAWLKVALLTYNIVSAIRQLCFEPDLRRVRLKKFRLLLIHLMGRMNRNNCVMGLRVCGGKEVVSRLQEVWKRFELPTQATAFKPLGKGGG
jgi:hypothetical protein